MKHQAHYLFFNELFTILLEGYFEFLIAGYMELNYPLSNLSGEITGKLTGYVCIAFCLILLPGFLLYTQIFKSLESIKDPVFVAKFGVTLEDVRKDHKMFTVYNCIYVLRRFLFVLISFRLKHSPSM